MDYFTVYIINDIVVVKVDLAAATLRDSQVLWDTFNKNSLFNKQKIIIDLSSATFVDSTFIGMVVKLFKGVTENKGTIKLIFPHITDLDSFRITGITKILDCFRSVEDAAESFISGSSAKKISIDQNNLYYNM